MLLATYPFRPQLGEVEDVHLKCVPLTIRTVAFRPWRRTSDDCQRRVNIPLMMANEPYHGQGIPSRQLAVLPLYLPLFVFLCLSAMVRVLFTSFLPDSSKLHRFSTTVSMIDIIFRRRLYWTTLSMSPPTPPPPPPPPTLVANTQRDYKRKCYAVSLRASGWHQGLCK